MKFYLGYTILKVGCNKRAYNFSTFIEISLLFVYQKSKASSTADVCWIASVKTWLIKNSSTYWCKNFVGSVKKRTNQVVKKLLAVVADCVLCKNAIQLVVDFVFQNFKVNIIWECISNVISFFKNIKQIKFWAFFLRPSLWCNGKSGSIKM